MNPSHVIQSPSAAAKAMRIRRERSDGFRLCASAIRFRRIDRRARSDARLPADNAGYKRNGKMLRQAWLTSRTQAIAQQRTATPAPTRNARGLQDMKFGPAVLLLVACLQLAQCPIAATECARTAQGAR